MRLIVVRHGETLENMKKIVQGQTYGTLSKKGMEQAKLLARRLKKEKLDVIFSSDLNRARNTAREIARFHPGAPVMYSNLLRERNLGEFEGKTWQEYNTARDASGLPKYMWRPRGGENYPDIVERAKKFLDQIFKKYRDKTVLVVTHGGFIRAIVSVCLDTPLKDASELEVPNTCVNILELKSDHKFKARLLSCVEHLDEKRAALKRDSADRPKK